MGLSLEEYAKQNPTAEPVKDEAIAESFQAYKNRQEIRAELAQLKKSITAMIEQGNAPEHVLILSLKAIATATNDPAWYEHNKEIIEAIYKGLEQQSLLNDNAAIAAQRVEAMQADYISKTRKRLKTLENACKSMEKALNLAYTALNDMDRAQQEDDYTELPF